MSNIADRCELEKSDRGPRGVLVGGTRQSEAVRLCRLGLAFTVVLSGTWGLSGCGKPEPDPVQLRNEGERDYKAGKYADALAMFKASAKYDRERPETYYWIARCQLELADQRFKGGQFHAARRYCEEAITSFDAAIGAFPGYSRAVQGKADALRLRGRHAAALELADWAAKVAGPDAKRLMSKGRDNAQAGDMDEAEMCFRQAIRVEPSNPATYAELGLFYMRIGNRASAVQSLQRAYQLNPGVPNVVAALVELGAMAETPHPAGGSS